MVVVSFIRFKLNDKDLTFHGFRCINLFFVKLPLRSSFTYILNHLYDFPIY